MYILFEIKLEEENTETTTKNKAKHQLEKKLGIIIILIHDYIFSSFSKSLHCIIIKFPDIISEKLWHKIFSFYTVKGRKRRANRSRTSIDPNREDLFYVFSFLLYTFLVFTQWSSDSF